MERHGAEVGARPQQLGAERVELRCRALHVVHDRRDLAVGDGGVDLSHGPLDRDGGIAERVRGPAQVPRDLLDRLLLRPDHPGELLAHLLDVLDRRADVDRRLVRERGLDPVGQRGEVAGDLVRHGRQTGDVRERVAGQYRRIRRLRVVVEREPAAREDLGLPVAEQRFRRQQHDRVLRQRRVPSDAHAHDDAGPAGLERDVLDPADRHAAQLHGVADQHLADLPEPRLKRDPLSAEAGALEPQGPEEDQGDAEQDHRPDGHLRSLPHATSSTSSGRPSMKARTSGSSVARISSGVPTKRICPSWSIAIRSATR